MRRRITFVQKPDAPFNLDQASLTPDSLTIHRLDALREERITVSHDEVPDEVYTYTFPFSPYALLSNVGWLMAHADSTAPEAHPAAAYPLGDGARV